MRDAIKRLLRWVLAAVAMLLAPAVVQTVLHAVRLKKKEKAAGEKERTHGQCRPSIPDRPRESKSMAEISARLRDIPFKPKPYNGVVATILFALADIIPMMLECRKSTCGSVYKYPEPFRRVTIESEDGTPIAGMVAIHDDGCSRPALLMVHGLFGSKNIWFSQQVVLSAYYGWGYNVMAIDLRFFGESKLLSDATGTGGWKEGQDIIAAVKFLKSQPEVTSVGVMGGSYGGASAMCAAYLSEPKDLIDGGIISFGGYGHVPDQVKFISTTPRPWEPFFPVYCAFMACFGLTLGANIRRFKQFDQYLREGSAEYYGMDADEILDRSSGALHFDEVKTPMLIVNSDDDPVIPTEQITLMEEKARGNPWIDVWRMKRGGHCGYATVDKNWMGRVCREFYDYWATPGAEI